MTAYTDRNSTRPRWASWQFSDWDNNGSAVSFWGGTQRLIALVAIILLAPLFALLFIAVKATSKGPFIYKQTRPGLNGQPFTAFKIRTMLSGADKDSKRARRVDTNDPMITPIGRILRDLKLDELPQLMNVVKGEMALVGPRPIAPTLQSELESKIAGFSRRLSVQPGLTSLAQVCLFDNEADDKVIEDWSTRFEAELDYIYRRSAVYDLVIIGLTVMFLAKKLVRRIPKKLFLLLPIVILLALSACSERLATRSFTRADAAYEKDVRAYGDRQEPAIVDIEPVSIPVENSVAQDPIYRVGSGDLLAINVFGEEGLNDLRVSVDGEGYIQVPFLERVAVAGRSVAEIQGTLKEGFARQFRNPWVVVDVAQHRSRPVYLVGQFNKPGVVYLQGPTNLLQAVSMASGMSDNAHLSGARLWRGGEIAAVDMNALLVDGRAAHNIYLESGDTIVVPSNSDNKAYVMGAVVRAGAVPFSNEPMTLLKALTQVGGPIKATALLSQVRVIRTNSAVEGQLILVNAKDILKGRAPDLQLQPDDIVYVPDNWIESWNQVIRAVTPTLQLAGGALQPFVQVKFLKGE
ncbi:MAG: sugar transferase [Kordiimonadaceae bacterium]|nr:sugar transferase [Kordiimonadaceae bacterium]MBO6570769.1 sugar transferase [Kordiimonadaceae bacterium]MBO6965450.1 sugar transferase [Kordiimonadaceae bacterium]